MWDALISLAKFLTPVVSFAAHWVERIEGYVVDILDDISQTSTTSKVAAVILGWYYTFVNFWTCCLGCFLLGNYPTLMSDAVFKFHDMFEQLRFKFNASEEKIRLTNATLSYIYYEEKDKWQKDGSDNGFEEYLKKEIIFDGMLNSLDVATILKESENV